MLKNGNKPDCEFMDDIVSYIYEEIGAAERAKFEKHLAGCSVCTDEFAGISNARFSVFEWRKEEFEDLATPEIVIPYPAKAADADTVSVGLLAGIRGWLSLVKFPVAVAAGLILCVGLGFLIMSFVRSGDQPIASNRVVAPVKSDNTSVVVPQVEKFKEPEVVAKTAPSPTVRSSDEIRTARAAERRRPNIKKQLPGRDQDEQTLPQDLSTLPVLSPNYEEADDQSLRLSDLIADAER